MAGFCSTLSVVVVGWVGRRAEENILYHTLFFRPFSLIIPSPQLRWSVLVLLDHPKTLPVVIILFSPIQHENKAKRKQEDSSDVKRQKGRRGVWCHHSHCLEEKRFLQCVMS